MTTGVSRQPVGGSNGGRSKGTPNREKIRLRAAAEEAVMKHTDLLRERISNRWRDGWRISAVGTLVFPDSPVTGEEIPPDTLDLLQPRIDSWDPVIELALLASDYSNDVNLRRQANSEAAQYLRPKLKSIELLEDPQSLALREEKQALAHRVVGLLDAVARAKREDAAVVVNG